VKDPVPFHLASACLAVVIIFLFSFYLQKLKREEYLHSPAPVFFLTCTTLLSAFFILYLGWSYAFFAFEMALGIFLGLLNPIFALCFFLANFFLKPWELATPGPLMNALPRLLAVVALLSCLIDFVRRREFRIRWNLSCTAYCGLLVWFTVSALFSGTSGESLNLIFKNFLPITIVFFLLINIISAQSDLRALRGVMIVSITGLMCISLYTTLSNSAFWNGNLRLLGTGMWGNSNDLAALIAFVIPFVIFPLNSWTRAPEKFVVKTLTLFILLSSLAISQSRGAILSLLVCTSAYFFFCVKTSRKRILITLVVLCIPVFLFLGIKRQSNDLSMSSASRMNYVIAGLSMFKHRPLRGVGPGNYPGLYEQHTPAFFEWGERTAHSSWVLALSETGFPGFALFLALYLLAMLKSWQIRRKEPEYFLCVLSYGVVMSFLSHTYLMLPYLLFALVQAYDRISETKIGKQSVSALAMLLLIPLVSVETKAEEHYRFAASSSSNKPLGNFQPYLSTKLRLKGSRKETLNFILKTDISACARLSVSSFEKQGQVPKTFPVSFYSMPPIHTKKASFPDAHIGKHYDPLILLSEDSFCPSAEKTSWIWGELKIPANTPPGKYSSTISLQAAGQIALSLRVWKMTIPDKPALPAYAELTSWYNLLGHYGKWAPNEATLAAKYISAMQAHRIYPLKSAIALPAVKQQDGQYFLDIRNHPDQQSSFESVTLRQRPAWAYYDFPSPAYLEMTEESQINYLRAIQNTLGSINRPGRAMFYLWDEPQAEEFPALTKLLHRVRTYAPSIKNMVTTYYRPGLKDNVDIFVPLLDTISASGYPSTNAYREVQKNGGELWAYVSCMSHGCEEKEDSGAPDFVIDRPPVYIRSTAWIAAKYNLDAFLYYGVNNGYQFYPDRDPWDSLWDFSGNGDGTLFYPGRPGEHGFEEHTPVPSIRLKVWREASYDSEYINWMRNSTSRKPRWWKKTYRALLSSPLEWNRKYSAYQRLRNRMGNYLNRHLSNSRRINKRRSG